MSRLHGYFAHTPVVKDDYLIGAVIFPGAAEIHEYPDIEICGHPLSEVKDLVEMYVYDGSQKCADQMLLNNIDWWTEKHIFTEIPYIALKIKYDPIFKRISFRADCRISEINNGP